MGTDVSRSIPSRFGKLLPSQLVGGDRRARLQRGIAFMAVLVVGAVITDYAFRTVQRGGMLERRQRFVELAGEVATGLQTGFDRSLETLLTIAPFFRYADGVSRAEFNGFVAPALGRHPAIYVFDYVPRVSQSGRAEFEAAARAQGFPDFEVLELSPEGRPTTAGRRNEYFPIYYADTAARIGLVGMDIGTYPEQGPLVLQACGGDSPVATPPFSLIEDPADVLSVAVVSPVRLTSTTPNERCDGIALVVLKINPLVEEAVGSARLSQLELTLLASQAPEDRRLLFKNYSGGGNVDYARPIERQIDFADHNWVLTMKPVPGGPLAPSGSPIWIYGVGALLSLLAAYSLSAVAAIGGLRRQVNTALELGQYQLGEKLGEGGMGTVYRAQHRMLARPAAIKLIRPESFGIAESRGASEVNALMSRFEKEAMTTAQLESPHTIGVYDFGKTPEGAFYYVMEMLDGMDLRTLVKKHGPMPANRVIYLLEQMCASLAEAHERGLIHRDVKPDNVFVCRRALEYDFVKILDFGLVKSHGPASLSVALTQMGTVLGTPAFMAPEMVTDGEVDGRADIYALGCVAYWMLTGEYVFPSDNNITNMLVAHVQAEPEPPSSRGDLAISADFDALILRCLKKAPEDRPQSVLEIATKLAGLQCDSLWTNEDAATWWERRRPASEELEMRKNDQSA